MKRLFINGIVYCDGQLQRKNILVENGLITGITEYIYENDELIDLNGAKVLPGLIDAHVHLREPGFEYKEDIASGLRSAAAGGFTSVVAMPNTQPPIDDPKLCEEIINRSSRIGFSDLFIAPCMTSGRKGEKCIDMSLFDDIEDVVAFTDDGDGVQKKHVMYDIMLQAEKYDRLLMIHAYDELLPVSDEISELLMISRDIMLALQTGARVHFQHISSAKALQIICLGKQWGAKLSCEATPHHIAFDLDDITDDNTGWFKMNPPIRGEKDRLSIINGLKTGDVDIIATDHAPHNLEEKKKKWEDAPAGVIGMECVIPVIFDMLIKKHSFTIQEIVRLTSTRPADLLGLKDRGVIEIGKIADMTCIRDDLDYKFNVDDMQSKARNCLFDGYRTSFGCNMTIKRGEVIWRSVKW